MNSASQLLEEFSRKINNMECHFHNNRLRLKGVANSFYVKQLLQERAKRLTGMQIENLVEVVPYKN